MTLPQVVGLVGVLVFTLVFTAGLILVRNLADAVDTPERR